MSRTAALLCAVLCLGAARASAQSQPPSQVVATGYGEITLNPDQAAVAVALDTHSPTASAAATENAARVAAIRAALLRLGVPADSITTSGYTVGRDIEYDSGGRTRVVGYVATNGMRIRLHRIDQVGPVIDAALAAGATRIDGVQFSSSAAGRARREALARAVAEARLDGETMARAGGGSLGEVLEITTTATPTPMVTTNGVDGYVNVRGNGATSLTPADIRVTAAARVRWTFVHN
jgi:uncharacterized protein YggE